MATAHHHRFTFEEYVQLVDDKAMKLEFLDGQIYAMSGGTPEHAGVTTNVSVLLSAALRGKPCRVYSPDLRVRARATGLATYVDVTVVCGQLELDPDDPKKHTALNPVVLVEVLSPSTEHYDRGEKLDHYKAIPSVQEVVFVAWDQRRVEIVRREANGNWTAHVSRDDETARVQSLECDLPLSEVYRDPLPTG